MLHDLALGGAAYCSVQWLTRLTHNRWMPVRSNSQILQKKVLYHHCPVLVRLSKGFERDFYNRTE